MRALLSFLLLTLSGCSLLASFNGLTGEPAACDGGRCESGEAQDGGADSSSTPDSEAASDGPPPSSVAFVMSSSKRIAKPGASTVTVTLPSAPAPDDYVLAVILSDDATQSITAQLPGWTNRTPASIDPVPSGSQMGWFSRVAGATEPSSYTFSVPGNDTVAAAIAVYRGVDTGSPNDGSFNVGGAGASGFCGPTTPLAPPYTYSPTPTTCATPQIATTRGGDMMVLLYALDSNASDVAPTWTTSGQTLPAGVSSREDVGNVAIGDMSLPAPGSQALGAATHSQTPGYSAVQVIALRPR